MAGFSSVKKLVDAEESGKVIFSSWRKSPSQVTTIGIWFDLSMSPGNPTPQYYASAPLTSASMSYMDTGGLYHGDGGNIADSTQYLRELSIMTLTATALPMPMILCDYLMYYPFVDEGASDEQPMTNTCSLPRFTSGCGVQIMPVSVAGRTGGQSFKVRYTNSDDVPDRISQIVTENSVSVIGSIATSDRATANSMSPFIPLQAGDKGVKSIQGVTMLGNDVGLFTLVLVKPLAQLSLRGIDAPVEIDYFLDFSQVPKFENNSYLNFLCNPAGSLAATALHGTIGTIWA